VALPSVVEEVAVEVVVVDVDEEATNVTLSLLSLMSAYRTCLA
jgi:hypothetical protein